MFYSRNKKKAWEKNRIEDIITIELSGELNKRENITAIPFIKPIEIVKKLGKKSQPWVFAEIGKLMKIHPLQPEIDIFYKEFRQDQGINREFPKYYGIELKYFRPRKKAYFKVDALYEKSFYEGFSQALGLLTLGLDYVSLWHFFDKNILTTFLANNYAKMCQRIISILNLPIGYRARWIRVNKEKRKLEFSEFKNMIDVKPKINPFLSKDIRGPGILVDELDPLRLSVIRFALDSYVASKLTREYQNWKT